MRMKRKASKMSGSTSCSSVFMSSAPSLSQQKMWRKSLPSCSSLRQLRGIAKNKKRRLKDARKEIIIEDD